MDERLRQLVSELLELPLEAIGPDLRRADTASWDSLNHLRLISAVESEFGAAFTMEEIAALQTPRELQSIIDDARGHARGDARSMR